MVMASTKSSSASSPRHLTSSASSSHDSGSSFGYFNFDSTSASQNQHQHQHQQQQQPHQHQQQHHPHHHRPSTTSGSCKLREPPLSSSFASSSSSSSSSAAPVQAPNSGITGSQGFQRNNFNLKLPSYKPYIPEVKITPANDSTENDENKNNNNEIGDGSINNIKDLKNIPTSPISASSFNIPHKFGSNLQTKIVDIKDLGVNEINTLGELKELEKDQIQDNIDLLIIDTRPFNQYSISRIKNALSICVPSTLLKRTSFHLSNIFKTMTAEQQKLIDAKLQSPNDLNIVFYDSSSNTEQCSFHLFQILKKFQLDISQYDKKIELFILNNGFTSFLHQEGIADQDTIFDFAILKSTKSADSFADFSLPSANPSSTFLLSMKKNHILPNENPNSASNSITVPKFDHPENLPTWIQPYLSPNSVNMVIRNFVKIENTENARIESVVSQKKHSPSICSPNCLCPDCDQLNYNLLDGSEHGYKNRYPNILPYEHSRVKLVQSPLNVSPGINTCSRYFPNMSPNNTTTTSTTPTTTNNTSKLQHLTPTSASSSDTSSSSSSNCSSACSSALVPPPAGTSLSTTRRRGSYDDYFNANFINVPQINKEARYIATQAPLPSTIDDFWKVVWHNNSEIIVSLTSLNEYGIKKSDIYWENSKQVKLLEEYENYKGLEKLTVRKIQLTRKNKSRIITQLHFQNWPDHGIADLDSLLTLTSVKDEFTKDKNSPIIVHCSAGCGRTGVFITVDLIFSAFKSQKQVSKPQQGSKKHLLDDVKDSENIDVWNTENDLIYFTVQQLRKQRISMVQTLNQFIFCYETVLQFLHSLEEST